jgi:hypothetical protein
MNPNMLSAPKGFCINSLAILLNTIEFEFINQCLTVIISCLAIAFWVMKIINERKANQLCQKDSEKQSK